MKINSIGFFILRGVVGSTLGSALGVSLFFWSYYGNPLIMKIPAFLFLLPFTPFIGCVSGTILWLIKSKLNYFPRTISCILTGAVLVATITFAYAYRSYFDSGIDYTDQKIYAALYGATVGAFSAGFAAWKGRKTVNN